MLRKLGKVFLYFLGLLVVVAAVMVVLGWRGFGQRATGARLARMEQSPAWRDGHFVNPQPLINDWGQMVRGLFSQSPHTYPSTPPPVFPETASVLATPPASGLRVTWMGHSTTLVELDGARFLTDPVWSERPSPYPWLGPRRFTPPPLALAELPPIDAIVISHDHYDHLDRATVTMLAEQTQVRFVVPLGVGAHLAYWGIDEVRITELDWWQETRIAGVTVTGLPARHASGRMLLDDDDKLWAGFALVGPTHRVYYSGDTGLFPAVKEIGERLGPFDLTMIEVGQYDGAWPDWHIGPEQAVLAHTWVRGKVMLPVHWGAFALAYHAWTAPMERTLAAAKAEGVTVIAPQLGEPVDPTRPAPVKPWWPALPYADAVVAPVSSSQL